jgi:hypothetical protein
MDLTFATHLAAGSRSECQIRNSTRNLYLLVVLDSNIRKRRSLKRDANVRIRPLLYRYRGNCVGGDS